MSILFVPKTVRLSASFEASAYKMIVSGSGIRSERKKKILNASILRFGKRTISGFKRAVKRLDLSCSLYLTPNSGQLLSSKEAVLYPVQIFFSGATNPTRQASFLSAEIQSKKSRYVTDIGGTTPDIGCLLPSGFPRLASSLTEIGGARINFVIPKSLSLS